MSKIDLKSVMKAIDTKDIDWYDNLSDDEKNEVNIWQLMRFTSSNNSSLFDIKYHYLYATNELVNVNFNVLRKHPELQFRLLQVVGIGSAQFHPWIKPSKSHKKNNLTEYLKTIFSECNDDELEIIASNDKKDIKIYLKERGLTDTEIKEVLK